MAISLNFTKDSISKILIPQSGAVTYRDTKERGLILIAGYGGSKVFYLYKSIDGRPTKIKIAPFPDFSVLEARVKAAELKNMVAKGINPAKKKRALKAEPTFKQLLDKYINDHAKVKNKSWQSYEYDMDKYARPIYDQKISTITRDDIQQLFNSIAEKAVKRHANITGKYAANTFLAKIRAIFNRAIEWELLPKNPTKGITGYKGYKRNRYITREEIPQFLQALADEPNKDIRDIILLYLFTGVRKNCLLSACWDEINLNDGTWNIPTGKSKNGRPQLIHLPKYALKLLANRKELAATSTVQDKTNWVFPSSRSSSGHRVEVKEVWSNILARAKLEDIRIHDLRRTFASWLAQSGTCINKIGQALNHDDIESTRIYSWLSSGSIRQEVDKTLEEFVGSGIEAHRLLG